MKQPERTLVVGSLEGGIRALRECLLTSGYNQATDRLIFLGNYVGVLPESPETVEALWWLKIAAVFEPIFLRGSNDKWTEMWLTNLRASPYWLSNEGTNVAKSYIRSEHLVKNSHREFFQNLKDYYVDDKNRAFVHAGFASDTGLGHEEMTSRYYFHKEMWLESYRNTRQYEITNRGSVKKFRSFLYEEVYISGCPTIDHTISRYSPELSTDNVVGEPTIVPMNRRNIWNMNTGAGQGYSVTIMDINSKEYWQSRPTRELYPKKKIA